MESTVTSDEPTIDEELSYCISAFEESEDSSREARERSERCRDYLDNKQYTAEELAVYKKRKQPPITINYIKRKVQFLCGFERRLRSDPKAFPRSPKKEQMAEAATDSLRYVADANDFDVTRSRVFENMLVEGFGGVDVIVVNKADSSYEVQIRWVPWDRLFYDPHSYLKDFEDADFKGEVIWMDARDAKRKWPDSIDSVDATTSSVSLSQTYDDKPRFTWCDNRRKRIRVVQIHYRWEGEWKVATFTKGGWLEEPMVSPYTDKDGNSCSSLIMRSAYVDRDNNRYGEVETMISLQDEINKRRSKALDLMTRRQTFGNKKAIPDTKAAKLELNKADGHVEMNADSVFGQDFGVIPNADFAAGQMQLLAQATQEMQASGPNAALAGKDPRQQSGRAIQAQQQGGAVEIEPLMDELRQWTRSVYEAAWMRVKEFWTEEKWIRVTDDEKNMKWVGLNQQVTLEQKLQDLPPEEQQQAAMSLGIQSPYDPRLKEVVEVQNNVNGLDVDITIEEGPDITTIAGEQFEVIGQMISNGLQLPPEAVIRLSPLRSEVKEKILEDIQKAQQAAQQAQQGQQQAAQQAQQVQDRKTMAGAAKDEADAQQTQVETALTVAQATQPMMY